MNNDYSDLGFQPEASNEPKDNNIQTLKDLLAGTGQGATFGFGDELLGAAKAAGEISAPSKENELKSFLDLYEQYRDQARQSYKEAQERSPYATMGGELVGGLVVPGFGAAKTGLTGAKTLGTAALQGLKTGTLAGGLYGAGASEADLLKGEVGKLAGDVATGGAVGGALGGTLASVVPGIKGLGKTLKEKDLVPEIIENSALAFQKELGGEKIVGKQARRRIEEETFQEGGKLTSALDEEISKGRKIKMDALNQADEEGINFDIKQVLSNYEKAASQLPETRPDQVLAKDRILKIIRDKLQGAEQKQEMVIPGEKVAEDKLRKQFAKKELASTFDEELPKEFAPGSEMSQTELKGLVTPGPKEGKLVELIPEDKIKKVTTLGQAKTDFSPNELRKFAKDIEGLTYFGDQPINDPEASKVVTGLTKELKALLKSDLMGDYGRQITEADKIAHAAMNAEEILSPALKGIPRWDKPARARVEKSIAQTIRSLEKEGSGGTGARDIVREALKQVEGTNPELVTRLGDSLNNKATAYDLARQIGAESAIQGSLVGTVQAKVIGAAGLAGRGRRALGDISKNIKGFISGSTPESLSMVRQGLEKRGDVPVDLLEKISNAEQAPNNFTRNTLLFSIMQNPSYRELLGISGYGEE